MSGFQEFWGFFEKAFLYLLYFDILVLFSLDYTLKSRHPTTWIPVNLRVSGDAATLTIRKIVEVKVCCWIEPAFQGDYRIRCAHKSRMEIVRLRIILNSLYSHSQCLSNFEFCNIPSSYFISSKATKTHFVLKLTLQKKILQLYIHCYHCARKSKRLVRNDIQLLLNCQI